MPIPQTEKPTNPAAVVGGDAAYVYWELLAEANIPGANFYARFDLPVFSSDGTYG